MEGTGTLVIERGHILRNVCEIAEFFRRIRAQARFADLSRAQLNLLRLEICGAAAECDWLARPADEWDCGLDQRIAAVRVSTQALRDAIDVRSLIFSILPDVRSASLCAYRRTSDGSLKPIVSGSVQRHEFAPAGVRSLAMRAKLLGLEFQLVDGVLQNLQPEEFDMNS